MKYQTEKRLTLVPTIFVLLVTVFSIYFICTPKRFSDSRHSLSSFSTRNVKSFVDGRPSLGLLGIRLGRYHMNGSTIKLICRSGTGSRIPCSDIIKKRKTSLVVLLLILGGDIELNPGPVKFPCNACKRPIAKNHRAVRCDRLECQQTCTYKV